MQTSEYTLLFLKVAIPALLLAVYVLISPAVQTKFWSQFIFFPYRGEERYDLQAVNNVPKQDVFIPSSNQSTLHGWFFKLPGAERIAIVNHGNAGNVANRVYIVETLLTAGVSVLVYDYQGYGKSTGLPSVPNICQDGDAAYKFTIGTLGYKPSDIILVGESLGCAVSTEVARHKPCAGLILQSGFSSLPDIATEKFPFLRIYPSFLFPQPNLNNEANLPEIQVPVLVIHGRQDCVIPAHHGLANFAAANEPKTLFMIESANHNDCMDVGGQAFQEAYSKFIQGLQDEDLAQNRQRKIEIPESAVKPI